MATPTSLPATFVAGNVLTAAQMNDLRGAFRILQVVRATDGTDRTTTSGTFVDASISVTITPQESASAILLIWSADCENAQGGTNARSGFSITDSSNNAVSGAEDMRVGDTDGSYRNYGNMTVIGYDTPATTSAVTYKGRFFQSGSTSVTLRNSGRTGQLYAIEVSA